jgi:hypothetical protein
MKLTQKGTTNLVSVLYYSEAFGKPVPDQPFDFLRDYPTDLILLRLSKLNAILYLEYDTDVQNVRGLKEVIFQDIPTRDERLAEIGIRMHQSHQGAFSAPVLSLIIKEALENYLPVEPDRIVNIIKFSEDLFKAILAYNERYYRDTPNLETFEGLFKVDLQQQYYLRRERFLKLDLLVKFAFISKFLSDDTKLTKPALEYCQSLGIGTVWGHAKFFLYLFERLLSREKTANHILRRNGADWPVLEQYVFKKETLKPGKKLSLLKDIVPRPLFEYDDDQLIILDYSYFTYGLDQGVLYSIYGRSSLKDGILFKNYNNYKAYIGLHYFERFYIGGFLTLIFNKRKYAFVSTDKYQDFIIRAGNDIFVMEVKMTDFNANGLENESFEDFKDFLYENFHGGKKGLSQIDRQIGHLDSDPELQQLLGIKDTNKLTIYPIIIYSDVNLDMNGVNEYMNEKYVSTVNGRFQKVQPVTLINGTFFMLYYRHLRAQPAVFSQWLDAYIKSVRQMKKRYQSERGPKNFLLYQKSFADHMRRKFPKEELSANLDMIKNDFELDVKNFGQEPN